MQCLQQQNTGGEDTWMLGKGQFINVTYHSFNRKYITLSGDKRFYIRTVLIYCFRDILKLFEDRVHLGSNVLDRRKCARVLSQPMPTRVLFLEGYLVHWIWYAYNYLTLVCNACISNDPATVIHLPCSWGHFVFMQGRGIGGAGLGNNTLAQTPILIQIYIQSY